MPWAQPGGWKSGWPRKAADSGVCVGMWQAYAEPGERHLEYNSGQTSAALWVLAQPHKVFLHNTNNY